MNKSFIGSLSIRLPKMISFICKDAYIHGVSLRNGEQMKSFVAFLMHVPLHQKSKCLYATVHITFPAIFLVGLLILLIFPGCPTFSWFLSGHDALVCIGEIVDLRKTPSQLSYLPLSVCAGENGVKPALVCPFLDGRSPEKPATDISPRYAPGTPLESLLTSWLFCLSSLDTLQKWSRLHLRSSTACGSIEIWGVFIKR